MPLEMPFHFCRVSFFAYLNRHLTFLAVLSNELLGFVFLMFSHLSGFAVAIWDGDIVFCRTHYELLLP